MRILRHKFARVLARMAALSSVPLTCICAFIPNVTHVQAQTQPFSVAITGPKSAIAFGSRCDVTVTLINISHGTIAIGENNNPAVRYNDYTIIVTDESSGTTLKQDLSKLEPRGPEYYLHSSRKTKHLQQGESIVQALPVCSLYSLLPSHNYSLRVDRKIPEMLGSGTATSNTIEIAVAP